MNNIPNKSFLLYFNYFATGEGQTYIIAHVLAPNESAARRKFLEEHVVKRNPPNEYYNQEQRDKQYEESIEYFNHFDEIIDWEEDVKKDNKGKELLEQFFNKDMVDYLIRAEKNHGLHEFYFKSYVNFS